MFISLARIPGCQAFSKAPAISNVTRQLFSPSCLLFRINSTTAFIASTVELPSVNPYCWGWMCALRFYYCFYSIYCGPSFCKSILLGEDVCVEILLLLL